MRTDRLNKLAIEYRDGKKDALNAFYREAFELSRRHARGAGFGSRRAVYGEDDFAQDVAMDCLKAAENFEGSRFSKIYNIILRRKSSKVRMLNSLVSVGKRNEAMSLVNSARDDESIISLEKENPRLAAKAKAMHAQVCEVDERDLATEECSEDVIAESTISLDAIGWMLSNAIDAGIDIERIGDMVESCGDGKTDMCNVRRTSARRSLKRLADQLMAA